MLEEQQWAQDTWNRASRKESSRKWSWEMGSCKAIVRTLVFTVREMGSQCRVLIIGVTSSDRFLAVAAVLKINWQSGAEILEKEKSQRWWDIFLARETEREGKDWGWGRWGWGDARSFVFNMLVKVIRHPRTDLSKQIGQLNLESREGGYSSKDCI